MWDFGTDVIKTDRINFENDVDGVRVYVQQIMDYCKSDNLSNHFGPIYDIIFSNAACYDDFKRNAVTAATTNSIEVVQIQCT